jgi:hypothetical protein
MTRNAAGTALRYAARMKQHAMNLGLTAALLPFLLLPLAPAASAATNEGGSQQVAAQTGCMNKWMFDGMWRVRVTKVVFVPATGSEPNLWAVTMQWNNGTTIANLRPTDSLKQDLVIALKGGDTMSAGDTTYGTLDEQKLDYHAFPASGQFTFTQPFRSANALDQANPPAKLLITFDVAKYRSYHPNGSGELWRQKTVSPNFRIDLTCGA